MPGGELQLNSYTKQDSFLTTNPQTTFFKKAYYQYNNFAKLKHILDFNHIGPSKDFYTENLYKLNVPKIGHLIKELYISIKLPKIRSLSGGCDVSGNPYCGIKWIDNLQFKIIKKIRFIIGGTKIQEFDSNILYLYYLLYLSKEKKSLLDRVSNQYYINKHNSETCFINDFELKIPIPVWFFEIPFPITCLEYMDLEIELELNSIYDLLLVRNRNMKDLSGTIINKNSWRRLTDNELSINNLITEKPRLYPKAYTSYIFLEKNELRRFFSHSHKYLIEKYNKVLVEDITSLKNYKSQDQTLKYLYDTFGSTKDVSIFIKKTRNDLYNQFFNFTNLDDLEMTNVKMFQNYFFNVAFTQWQSTGGNLLDYLEYFVLDMEGTSVVLPIVTFPLIYAELGIVGNIIITYGEAFRSSDILLLRENWSYRSFDSGVTNTMPQINNSFKQDIIEELRIKFNNMTREEYKSKQKYQELELFKYYPSSNNNSIYLFNFSIFPKKLEPSGQCNFSQIQKVHFEFKLNIEHNETYNLEIYNRYYNILELSSGSVKFVFFK